MVDLRLAFMNHKLVRVFLLSCMGVFSFFIGTTVFAEEAQADPKISILMPLLSIALFSIMCVIIHQTWFKDESKFEKILSTKKGTVLGLILASGFVLRIILAATNQGYVNDLSLFHYWGNYAYNNGILNLYQGDFFLDYPPAYMFVLYVLAWLQDLFNIQYGSAGFLILYKLPAIVCDLISAIFIYKISLRKYSVSVSLGVMLLYWMNPAVILDGAVWGQVDSIFALVLVVSIYYFTNRNIVAGSIMFALTALIKPQAFIFMPIVLLVLWYEKRWKSVGISAVYGFGTFLIIGLPLFLKGEGIKQLIDLYTGTLTSYAYGSVNAFNIYSLFGFNWVELNTLFLGIPLKTWGNLGIIAAVIYAAWIGLRSKLKYEHLYFIAAALIGIVFVFVTKMHERYMFVILLLLIMSYLQVRDRRLLHVFYGFTITNMLNFYDVLAFSPQTTFVPNDGVAILCAVGNIVLICYMLYIGYDLYIANRQKLTYVRDEKQVMQDHNDLIKDEFMDNESFQAPKRWYHIGMTKKDWLIVAAVTVIYGIVAFTNLGDMKAPKTVWYPEKEGSSVVLDLGKIETIGRITTFGGVGSGEYTYSYADELGNWSNTTTVTADHVSVFAWHEENMSQQARYIKITAQKQGFRIHELAVYALNSDLPLNVSIVTELSDPNGSKLIDEQGLAQYHHAYMHGSYFDEVYHARTAYEHIEGLVAYESTHPPLGKLIIALGIQLFGFGPFGWRFMGTLFGVLMLPLIYFMAKAICRKTIFATSAIVLFAVDFMHFTQTRIATIDVYGVFFIMLMFFFMNQYMSMNFYREKLVNTWIPLGLAGLAFGLGVASKWIAIYGGAGLAIMLIIVLWRRYAEYRAAKAILSQSTKSLQEGYLKQLKKITSTFVPYTFATLAICVIFYIVVPVVIYALANIPVLRPLPTGYTLQALIDYQVNMYNYHSHLVSSHPFSSTWWEWPFMKRPVWYFVDSGLPEGLRSTIAAFGNPLIWWTGVFAMIATIFISIRKRQYMVMTLFIAYGSQYIPWMLVPRETFIYHYFAMVPFMILSIAYIMDYLVQKYTWAKMGRIIYIAVAVLLFVLFYPALSGAVVSQSFIEQYLRWFPSWLF